MANPILEVTKSGFSVFDRNELDEGGSAGLIKSLVNRLILIINF